MYVLDMKSYGLLSEKVRTLLLPSHDFSFACISLMVVMKHHNKKKIVIDLSFICQVSSANKLMVKR